MKKGPFGPFTTRRILELGRGCLKTTYCLVILDRRIYRNIVIYHIFWSVSYSRNSSCIYIYGYCITFNSRIQNVRQNIRTNN